MALFGPKLSRKIIIYVLLAFFLLLSLPQLSRREYSDQILKWIRIGKLIENREHPIDKLVAKADRRFKKLLDQRTYNLSSAAQAYRARRGRHPPPEFDKWFEYAEESNALAIEEFFDGIYDDLEVFWSLDPSHISALTTLWPNVVSIRKHEVKIARGLPRLVSQRMDLLKQIQHLLPDVDMAFSTAEQQAVIISWENVDKALKSAAETKPTPLPPSASVPFNKYRKIPPLHVATEEERSAWKNLWLSKDGYREMARGACPPNSPGRLSSPEADFSVPPNFGSEIPPNSFKGFVRNWTEAKSPCVHKDLLNLHGTLVSPTTDRRHREFFPLFAESKIQDVNNVIVFPSRYYWDDESGNTRKRVQSSQVDTTPWEEKEDKVTWRGEATGGNHNKRNWMRFHRQRFVAMANSTWVTAVEAQVKKKEPLVDDSLPVAIPSGHLPEIFPLPLNSTWSLSANKTPSPGLGQWVDNFTDVGFTHLLCNPATGLAGFASPGSCTYLSPHYSIKKEVATHNKLKAKYIPDLDGNGASQHFLTYLKSNSLPIKATIFSEWHDSRLIPWKHFVPMDNTFADWWAIMDYFLGYNGGSNKANARKGHDFIAKAIAESGKEWADRVLRREDVLLYTYRLVLEYARICDPNRDRLAFTEDTF